MGEHSFKYKIFSVTEEILGIDNKFFKLRTNKLIVHPYDINQE